MEQIEISPLEAYQKLIDSGQLKIFFENLARMEVNSDGSDNSVAVHVHDHQTHSYCIAAALDCHVRNSYKNFVFASCSHVSHGAEVMVEVVWISQLFHPLPKRKGEIFQEKC